MKERNYLLNVLAISSVPRVISFVLKLISYPIMVRSVGAMELGIVMYIGAVIAVTESFVDFGASSAAGKDIASAREHGDHSMIFVIKKWGFFQLLVASIGFVPFLIISYLISQFGSDIVFDVKMLIILISAVWLTIFINFIRATLTSMLAFRALAILDMFESIFRSFLWIGVAIMMPTALGLALSNIILALLSLIVGLTLVLLNFRKNWKNEFEENIINEGYRQNYSLKVMLMKSLDFLWLRFATRMSTSVPTIMFGRFYGAELVGIIGGFSRILILCNFPFGVIGNALSVRAPGIVIQGLSKARAMWDVVSRVSVFSVVLAGLAYLSSNMIGHLLFPGNSGAVYIVEILSIVIITNAVTAIVAPISDYVGSLRSRNTLLSIFSVLQFIVLWIGGMYFSKQVSIMLYVTMLTLINIGYIKIALRKFFSVGGYQIRPEVLSLLITILIGVLVSVFLNKLIVDFSYGEFDLILKFMTNILLFFITISIGFMINKRMRTFYSPSHYFDYTEQEI